MAQAKVSFARRTNDELGYTTVAASKQAAIDRAEG
jgi:hypothetical protein